MITLRRDVYDAIDSEREYQKNRHERITAQSPHRDEDHSIADWLVYMEHHMAKVKEHIYMLDFDKAMDEVRKVTALGVACMEYKGVKKRESK
jgi:hypothetical protein